MKRISLFILLSICLFLLAWCGLSWSQEEAIALVGSGNEKLALKDYQSALQYYNKAIELDSVKSNAGLAMLYANRCIAKYYLKDNQGVIQDCSKAIELNPNTADAYNNRGLAKSALWDHEGAIQDYNKAIELDPNQSRYYNNRGIERIFLEKRKEGCYDLQKAVDLGLTERAAEIKTYCK